MKTTERPRGTSPGFARLAIVTTVATLGLVTMGGTVRATDSGLACPDWPRCFGMWIPPADVHIWLEHSHRLLAGVAGIAMYVMAVWAWRRYRGQPGVVRPAVAIAVIVTVQAGLGALVVLQLLRPSLVAVHLGVAAILIAYMIRLCVNAAHPVAIASVDRDRGLERWAVGVSGLILGQMVLGSYATGVAAAYVFNSFPIWTDEASVLGAVTLREWVHLTHRGLGYIAGAAVIALAVRAYAERRRRLAAGRWAARDEWLVRLPVIASVLVIVQIGLGVTNVLTRAATWSTVSHLTVAAWMWSALILLVLLARRYAPEPEARTDSPIEPQLVLTGREPR